MIAPVRIHLNHFYQYLVAKINYFRNNDELLFCGVSRSRQAVGNGKSVKLAVIAESD